jgi:hypothetical protein
VLDEIRMGGARPTVSGGALAFAASGLYAALAYRHPAVVIGLLRRLSIAKLPGIILMSLLATGLECYGALC